MPKSWCSMPAGKVGGSSSSDGSWHRRRRSSGPSASTAACSSAKEEVIIFSGDEKEQAPPEQPPQLLKEYALMDEDFVRQIELMTERSLGDMGSWLPSLPSRVKEEPASPPRHRVKNEQASMLLPVKEEPALPRQNRGIKPGLVSRLQSQPPPQPQSNPAASDLLAPLRRRPQPSIPLPRESIGKGREGKARQGKVREGRGSAQIHGGICTSPPPLHPFAGALPVQSRHRFASRTGDDLLVESHDDPFPDPPPITFRIRRGSLPGSAAYRLQDPPPITSRFRRVPPIGSARSCYGSLSLSAKSDLCVCVALCACVLCVSDGMGMLCVWLSSLACVRACSPPIDACMNSACLCACCLLLAGCRWMLVACACMCVVFAGSSNNDTCCFLILVREYIMRTGGIRDSLLRCNNQVTLKRQKIRIIMQQLISLSCTVYRQPLLGYALLFYWLIMDYITHF
ncbi:uncharacterized protein LOC125554690 [Triticum urartu]|uniref:uncharacterized protein LOC125554690 n=1 Tax=Triticum urartu TaxID=4572 RepID=UPI002044B522|nr:uncharacterized protein LOC125554690 [Triticum urartu]